MKLLYPLAIILASMSLNAQSQTDNLLSGEYISEGGWGVMLFNKNNHFSIEAMGGNAHSCSLEGVIKQQQAIVEAAEKNKPCVINFEFKDKAIIVTSVTMDSCRYFCGARAAFDGLYLKPNEGCGTKQREKTRQQFNYFYQAKNYQQAYITLEPLLNLCTQTLDWLEEASIRNDMAMTQYHLGLFDACQQTLKPLKNSIGRSGDKLPDTEAELKTLLPPTDFDNYLPFAKATWHNWTLCNNHALIKKG